MHVGGDRRSWFNHLILELLYVYLYGIWPWSGTSAIIGMAGHLLTYKVVGKLPTSPELGPTSLALCAHHFSQEDAQKT